AAVPPAADVPFASAQHQLEPLLLHPAPPRFVLSLGRSRPLRAGCVRPEARAAAGCFRSPLLPPPPPQLPVPLVRGSRYPPVRQEDRPCVLSGSPIPSRPSLSRQPSY